MEALHLASTESKIKVKPNKVKPNKVNKVKPRRKARLQTGDKIRASSFFGLAICGLAVSLPHLASEIGLLTSTSAFAAALIAVVIDLGMVATKAHLSADGPARRVAWSVLGACTVVSIILNAHAFVAHAESGFGIIMGIGFGIFLPLFILALSYLGSEVLLGHKD